MSNKQIWIVILWVVGALVLGVFWVPWQVPPAGVKGAIHRPHAVGGFYEFEKDALPYRPLWDPPAFAIDPRFLQDRRLLEASGASIVEPLFGTPRVVATRVDFLLLLVEFAILTALLGGAFFLTKGGKRWS